MTKSQYTGSRYFKRVNHTMLKKKILSNIKINTETNCWEWQKGCYNSGYGSIWWKEKTYRVHRLVYMIFKGEIPKGMCVLHHCDNPSCCNPEHLWLGTHADNMKDMAKKGRHRYKLPPLVRGEKHPSAKLNNQQVQNILASDEKHRILAKKYNVGRSTITAIKNGRNWSHI